MSLRENAEAAVIEAVSAAAIRQHEPNYGKLYIERDGTVSWREFISASSGSIDREADGFREVPYVILAGTGWARCNCDYCNAIYDVREEREALADGREYDRAAKYGTQAEAINDAVNNSDLSDLEQGMLTAFATIKLGYFNDEPDAALQGVDAMAALPEHVVATWDAADWDDDKMTASRYRYYTVDECGYRDAEIELTDEQAARYTWGTCNDTTTGGMQWGEL